MRTFFKNLNKPYLIFAIIMYALFSFASPASAHVANSSSMDVTVKEKTVELTTSIPLKSYNSAKNTNYLTEQEVLDNKTVIEKYLQDNISVEVNGKTLPETVEVTGVKEYYNADHIDAKIIATSDTAINGNITITDTAVIEADRLHSVYLFLVSDFHSGNLSGEENTPLGNLNNFGSSYTIERTDSNPFAGFISSVHLGFLHIQGGYDHLLFLAMLLVPAPLVARKGGNIKTGWEEKRTGKFTLKQTLWIVSAFTIGHSLSLAVVTLTKMDYNPFIIEFLVAGSVGLAAAHAVKPIVQRGEIWIAGIFGLVHGTAFAGTLQRLNLESWPLVQSLVGFNVGVELAQLTALAIFLPLVWFASRWKYYWIVRLTLAAFGILACIYWIVNLIITGPQ